jgi:hypothetical protein
VTAAAVTGGVGSIVGGGKFEDGAIILARCKFLLLILMSIILKLIFSYLSKAKFSLCHSMME